MRKRAPAEIWNAEDKTHAQSAAKDFQAAYGPAQARWRAVNAPHLVALVRAGAVFTNGKLLERPDDLAA
ncbi:hypothetical protein ABZ297_27020 [Nonomuraea sp. NPDC005983]|uniref:hypothetical protein n=1 Tax=Nonomuraea sp. NPDC005983 TaxID=3155595 RepID=UPI0033A16DEC